jgi:DUF2934 family protein
MAKQMTDSDPRPSHEEIARVAYTIFEKKGRVPGRDLENWLEAESQLMAAARKAGQSHAQTHTPARSATRTVLNHRA